MKALRLRRDPDLVVVWRSREMLLRNVRTGGSVRASPAAVLLLDLFGEPRSVRQVARASGIEPARLGRAVQAMARLGLLVPDGHRRRPSRLEAWDGNVASALYHAAVRDGRYRTPAEAMDWLRRRRAEAGPPPTFKRYVRPRRVSLDGAETPPARPDLAAVLQARRTTRDFSPQTVPLAVLAAVVRGTWGQTGWLEGGDLGRMPTRTSPSGGALHPIECYVLAWRVEAPVRGLFHYDVRANELRQLRGGELGREAARLASGQGWVGRAAFLCVMTAAFERTAWKYRQEQAYRTVWLEAGHFAQTFALLCTSYGLGAFTTAAMQDSRIEGLLGLDGRREFPVYLCGAGVPGRLRVSPPWTPLSRRASTRPPLRR